MLHTMLLLLVAALCTLRTSMAAADLKLGRKYPIGSEGEKWTATCIASGSADEDVSLIGGYVTHTLNGTADFKVIKSDATSGQVLWTQTIQPESGTANMVLRCASDCFGDLYVATASNSSTFHGISNKIPNDAHGLFLSKINGKDGKFAWTRPLNRRNMGTEDLLDVTWDRVANRIIVFGQMYINDTSKQAQLMHFDAANGDFLKSIPIGSGNAIASGLAVDGSGQVYVAYSSSSAMEYGTLQTCNTKLNIGCTGCFVTKYAINGTNLWTKVMVPSYREPCTGPILAVDRVTDNLVVFMTHTTAIHLVYLFSNGSTGLALGYSGSLSVGAVFVHDVEILATMMMVVGSTFKTSIYLFSLESSLLRINESDIANAGNELLPRSVNATVEHRTSGMAWSEKSAKVMILTKMDSTNSIDGDIPIWVVVESPVFTLPERRKCTVPTRLTPPLLPVPVPDLAVILGPIFGVIFLAIVILALRVHVHRRKQLLGQTRDKEQQKKQYLSSDALARSSNMLFSRDLKEEMPGLSAPIPTGPGNIMRTSSSTAYVTPSQKSFQNHARSPGTRSETHQQFSDVEADIGLANSKSTFSSIAMHSIVKNSDMAKLPPGDFMSSSNTRAQRNGNTAFVERAQLSGAHTGRSAMHSIRENLPTIRQLTPSSVTGDTTLVDNAPAPMSLTTTTMMIDQKVMSIPGFLEMQDGIDFTLGKELARGGGGAVYLGEARNHEIIRMAATTQIVVKRVFENKTNIEESDNTFFQEVAIMWLLNGRNIAKIVGFCSTPKSILMKFYPCGSLSDLIHFQSKKPKLAPIRYDVLLALRLATDVACGVTEIHKEGLFHSDLKPPNILLDIDEQGVLYAVITDFGVTQVVTQSALLVKAFRVSKTAGASPRYAAPELLDHQLVTVRTPTLIQAADTFSFAVILAELMMRMAPWHTAKSIDEVIQGVIGGQRAYRRPLNFGGQEFHQKAASLVEQCWAQAPWARPAMHSVHAELLLALERIHHGN